MVISHSHNFIFLRVPKNASTSLATFFVKNMCDENDQYTVIGDSMTKSHKIPDRVNRKYAKQYRMIHLTLQEIMDECVITPEQLEGKTVISLVRHPLERQLSLYFFKKRGPDRSPAEFREWNKNGFIESDGSNHILQSDYPVYNGKNYGTFWLYDDLQSQLDSFVAERAPEINTTLPTYKSQFKPKKSNTVDLVEEYYDDRTRRVVLEYFAKDVELYERLKGENR